jgi:hypothetical protein
MENNNINVLTSIKTNYLSWIVILLSISIVSQPFIAAGFITFFSLLLFAYFVHRGSHDFRNVFTILHHYHHENDNFFSHFSQIILELSLGMLVVPFYYYLGNNYINIWTAILFTLFYSTVHNYNYGQLRVNDVHFLHHKEINTNIGPDVCDIAFNTKNKKNTEVENTNHYIPNIIIITILVLIVKHFVYNSDLKDISLNIFCVLMVVFALFISISSIYLYFTYDNNKNKEKGDNEKEKDNKFLLFYTYNI